MNGKDGGEIELHDVLAVEVANLIVPRLSSEDLVKAIAGALQWRPVGDVQKVQTALAANPEAKPRLRGRQSCLFLAVDDPQTGAELAEVVL